MTRVRPFGAQEAAEQPNGSGPSGVARPASCRPTNRPSTCTSSTILPTGPSAGSASGVGPTGSGEAGGRRSKSPGRPPGHTPGPIGSGSPGRPPAATHYVSGREFEALASHTRQAYLRYSFTRGTEQEVAFLINALALRPGMRVLDVGCGPGRHTHAMGRLGLEVTGVDIAAAFLAAAAAGAPDGPGTWVRADARQLPFARKSFDAAISLCQGGFGLLGGYEDGLVMEAMAQAVRPGGRVAVSAFSAYFAVRHLEAGDTFDAAAGVNHERTEVRDPEGATASFDLWTTCFTPRELRLMARGAGLDVTGLWSVAPGAYAARPPDLEHPEFLLTAAV